MELPRLFSPFRYLSGEDVRKGDVVKICCEGGVWKSAKIAETFKAGEDGAHDYSLDEGGFLVEFPDGGLEAWHEADEDIDFVSRAGSERDNMDKSKTTEKLAGMCAKVHVGTDTSTRTMNYRLSDFLSAADTDDDAIARMLAAGRPHASRTYHIDVPVTIRRAILLPSDTTVLVEADIRQADGAFDCVFRGENVALDTEDLAFLPPVVEPLRNIRIVGVGAGRKIAGPDINHRIVHPALGEREAVGDYFGIRTHQIDLSRCDGFEIADLVFEKTRGWCLNFDFCSHGAVHGLRFHSTCKNGDGINVRTGCHDIELRDIAGDTSDDLLAINASAGPTMSAPSAPYWLWNEGMARMRHSFPARDLDVRRITVRNCRYERVKPNVGCVLIVVAKNGSRCTDIDVEDVAETSSVPGRINLFLGAFRDSRGTFRPGDIRNVRIVGARSAPATNACVTSNVSCADVRIERCAAGNGVLAELADKTGFTFVDCSGEIAAYPGYGNID